MKLIVLGKRYINYPGYNEFFFHSVFSIFKRFTQKSKFYREIKKKNELYIIISHRKISLNVEYKISSFFKKYDVKIYYDVMLGKKIRITFPGQCNKIKRLYLFFFLSMQLDSRNSMEWKLELRWYWNSEKYVVLLISRVYKDTS